MKRRQGTAAEIMPPERLFFDLGLKADFCAFQL